MHGAVGDNPVGVKYEGTMKVSWNDWDRFLGVTSICPRKVSMTLRQLLAEVRAQQSHRFGLHRRTAVSVQCELFSANVVALVTVCDEALGELLRGEQRRLDYALRWTGFAERKCEELG
jgi:hypothetical protein